MVLSSKHVWVVESDCGTTSRTVAERNVAASGLKCSGKREGSQRLRRGRGAGKLMI